jgi:hypothetical protein
MDSVIIRLIDLPAGINGLTMKDENGDYNIYINAGISDDARGKAFRHEIEHIRNGDFTNDSVIAYHIEKKTREAGERT